jgi:hypothetical protein
MGLSSCHFSLFFSCIPLLFPQAPHLSRCARYRKDDFGGSPVDSHGWARPGVVKMEAGGAGIANDRFKAD